MLAMDIITEAMYHLDCSDIHILLNSKANLSGGRYLGRSQLLEFAHPASIPIMLVPGQILESKVTIGCDRRGITSPYMGNTYFILSNVYDHQYILLGTLRSLHYPFKSTGSATAEFVEPSIHILDLEVYVQSAVPLTHN